MINPLINLTIMKFKYSICDPLEKEIKYIPESFYGDEILKIAKEYPWIDKLKITEKFKPEENHFSPSLDFTNIDTQRSFCLTAHYDNENKLESSLWYNRPKKIKTLFGLFKEKEKFIVDDSWGYDLEGSLEYLKYFIDRKYEKLEMIFK